MDKFLDKILIIDGQYSLCRAMYSKQGELKTSTGIVSGGFYGFVNIIYAAIKRHPGYYPVICWDYGRSRRRLDLFSNYKHNADQQLTPIVPDSDDDVFLKNMRSQRIDIIEFCRNLGIPSIRLQGWEGDDLVYIVNECCKKSVILTDDKDMIQMCSDNVKIDRATAKEVLNINLMEDKFKYPEYMYYKVIAGDPSDNIAQVAKGVGKVTAEKIAKIIAESKITDEKEIKKYLTENLDSFGKLSTKIKKIIDCFDVFELNMKLMDFKYIEIPEDMQTIIESELISTIRERQVPLQSYKYLSKYEIKTIRPENIVMSVLPYKAILMENLKL